MNNNFIEEQVVINGEVKLRGTLTIPNAQEEKLPAVLIINGSGGADRDGNLKKPLINGNMYKDLAHFITNLGFITLRYDKRAVGESEGDPYSTGMMDLVNDINSNVNFLRNHPKVDRVILVGHSEGCILSTIANSINPVNGLVLIAGAGTNLRNPLIYQNTEIAEEVKTLKGIKGFFLRLVISEEKLLKQHNDLYNMMINSTGDTIKLKGKKMPAKWFREHFKYTNEQVLNDLKEAKCPILAVTGDRDVQADSEDLKILDKLGKDHIKTVVIKDMDHMLKEFTGPKTVLELMKQYKREVSQPMHPELKKVLEQWFKDFKENYQ